MFNKIITGILVAVFCTAIGRGIVLALSLDEFVASMITVALTPENLNALAWLLSGLVGLLGLAVWHSRNKFWGLIGRDHLSVERKKLVEGAVGKLPEASVNLLRQLLISGRPSRVVDSEWKELESANLVERDFTGPKGIKEELKLRVEAALFPPSTNASLQEFKISGPEPKLGMEPGGFHSKISGAYVHFTPGGNILASNNISSVTDVGNGQFTIAFAGPFEANTLVALPIGETSQFQVTSAS